jgi:hypothetical protein
MTMENSGMANFFNFFSFPMEPNEPAQNVNTSLDSSLDNTSLDNPHDTSISTFSNPKNQTLSSQEHTTIMQEFDSDPQSMKAASQSTFPGLGILIGRSPRFDYATLFPPLETRSSSGEQASSLGLGFGLFETDIIDVESVLGSVDPKLTFSPPAGLSSNQIMPWNSNLNSSYSFTGSAEESLFFPGVVIRSPKLSEESLNAISFFSSSPPSMPILSADINMYEAMSSKAQTDGGINPSEIQGDLMDPRQEEESDVFGLPYLVLRDNLIAERGAEERTEHDNTILVINDAEGSIIFPDLLNHAAEGSIIFPDLLNQEVEGKGSPELPMPRYPPLSCNVISPDPNTGTAIDKPVKRAPSPKASNIDKAVEQTSPPKKARRASATRAYNKPFMNGFVQTPVLNAHLGIHVDDLIRRAEKYRARNPGQPLCQQWLLAYAGQLSEQGEQLGEWRCYVVGCSQKNKRRDHILTHVGSHVDERPFQCERW